MTDPTFDTAVTRTYGCRLPIVAGGLMWLSDASYVAAGANAGIMSFLTAASFPEPADLRAEIAKCRKLCGDRPFGVNVSMLPKLVEGERIADTFRLIADEGVRFVETSGRNPEAFLPFLKDAGIRVLHKVPSVRYAVKAQQVGVDMVSIVGAECGGHPGLDLIGSMVNQALAERQLDIPFLIGGGIGAGSQIVSALASGAAGVVIGTRFLVSEEISAHPQYKRALVAANERDTTLTMSSVRNTVRTLSNETTEIVRQLEADNPDISIAELMPYVSGAIGRKAYETGDVSRGMLSAGQALGLTDAIAPLADIVAQLEQEAGVALARLRPQSLATQRAEVLAS
ncbi:nitronate monooxygenase [Leisingera caerulea]|jgi:nitronate monooxygenase|uniref:Nitronate monooxygenase n=1 Tax=Leisingera caerulea TaxID=506591 RepID=A0ABY5WTV8_LEICA|nr:MULTISPECIES: nitronate monooxygenase [Roseobacteraceae]MAE87980.1 2-nitropropane dioxygenase [Pelagibaca sp.]MBN9678681.1 nitronate monooxygenase [Salipiger bermudensis]MBY6059318.1 nitronate monooxygenase [Leisingera daeponensis]MCA1288348.1 nitronate monooxygenase [Salipiger bermudensis]UWQ57755.1 nitronate monooxygenase [Leisingera caerulea]